MNGDAQVKGSIRRDERLARNDFAAGRRDRTNDTVLLDEFLHLGSLVE